MRNNLEEIQTIVGVLEETREDMLEIAGNILNMKETLEHYMDFLLRKRENLKRI